MDLYWIVMPTLDKHGAHFHWLDVSNVRSPSAVHSRMRFWSQVAAAGSLHPWWAIRASSGR